MNIRPEAIIIVVGLFLVISAAVGGTAVASADTGAELNTDNQTLADAAGDIPKNVSGSYDSAGPTILNTTSTEGAESDTTIVTEDVDNQSTDFETQAIEPEIDDFWINDNRITDGEDVTLHVSGQADDGFSYTHTLEVVDETGFTDDVLAETSLSLSDSSFKSEITIESIEQPGFGYGDDRELSVRLTQTNAACLLDCDTTDQTGTKEYTIHDADAEDPNPEIESVSDHYTTKINYEGENYNFVDGEIAKTPTINPGDEVTFRLHVRNKGGNAGDFSSMQIQFPEFDVDGDSQYITDTFGTGEGTHHNVFTIAPGDTVYNADETTSLASSHAVEWSDGRYGWLSDEVKTLEVTFEPQETGTFPVYYRATLTNDIDQDGENNKFTTPSWSLQEDPDQDGYYMHSFEIDVEPDNEPPEADAGGPYSVLEDDNVNLDSSDSYDPDGEIVETDWTVTDGPGSISGDTYHAPTSVSSDSSVTVELEVTDDDDATDTDTATITVKERAPPQADAGSSYSVSEGESVELDASDSSASDSEIVDTDWSLIDGPGDLSGDTYTAPVPIDSDSSATVELEVTDEYGKTDTDTATITIDSDAGPNADAGGPYTVEMDGSVALDSSDSSAPDTTIEDTGWVVEDGPGSVNGDTYYAPESVSSDTTATVELIVTDSNDATGTDTATISIEAPDPPKADAGGPYVVQEKDSIGLDASDSTAPDGNIDDTEWEVISGPGSISKDTYNAPSSVDDDSSATVELTVTDSNDATATDTTTISITTLEPPTADAGGPYSVEADETVNLDASDSTAPDGKIADTEWRVIDGPGSISGERYAAPDTISDKESALVEVTITDSNDATDTDTATVDLISDEPSHQFILTNVAPSHSGAIEPETTLEIETTIENRGQDSSIQPVELFFEGERVDEQIVELGQNDDEIVTLTLSVPADAGGYDWYVRTNDDQSETHTVTVDSVDQYGHITGSVLTLDYEPVAGTTVELIEEGADDPTETTITGPDGIYTFTNVPADQSYYIEATANSETTTAYTDSLEDGTTVNADLVLPIELGDEFSASVTNKKVAINGSTTITVQSENARHLEISGDTESWTITSMDPLAGVIGNPTMVDGLPYESGDEEWFYADSDLDELTIELSATVDPGVYEFTAHEFDGETELVDEKTVEIEVTDGDYGDWPVDQNTAAAIDQDGDGDLALDDLRHGVAEWQTDGEIDGVDLSLADLRELVEWWAE